MKFSKIIIFLIGLFSNSGFGRVQVLFSPIDHPTTKLIETIDRANKRIFAAIYMLTDKNIVQALIRAQNRKVTIQIILDKISVESPWTKAELLIESGIKLFLKKSCEPKRRAKPSFLVETINVEISPEKPETPDKLSPLKETTPDKKIGFNFHAIMHNKYAIIDNLVWTGSFNWTVSANSKNNENVLIISDEKEVLERFLCNFQSLLDLSTEINLELFNEMRKNSNFFGQNKTSQTTSDFLSIETTVSDFVIPTES